MNRGPAQPDVASGPPKSSVTAGTDGNRPMRPRTGELSTPSGPVHSPGRTTTHQAETVAAPAYAGFRGPEAAPVPKPGAGRGTATHGLVT